MKTITLARVSDKKQDSNEAQTSRISEYVKMKDLQVWKSYEIEESSTQGDREKFQEIIKDIEDSDETIALVVDTVDRLQRSFKESVIFEEYRKAGKVEIHFYRENLVVHKESNSADLLRWDMAVMFARGYVLQLSDNVKRKQEQMRRNGEWPGRPPIGYKSVYNETGQRTDIIPDLDIKHYIIKIFELYATGNYSIKTLRDHMVKAGFRGTSGKKIAPSMIDNILENSFYYGLAKSKTKNITWNHKYLPIISKELFDKCQEVKQGWNKKPFKYASKPFIFRGIVRCSKCGCSMSPELKKGKYIYYSCTNARKDICSEKIYVPESDMLKPVYEVLEAFSDISDETINKIVSGLKKTNEAKNAYHKDSVEALRKEYDLIQGKINRMMDLLIEDSITKDDYDKKLKEFKSRQQDINIQIEDHTKADENYYITASTVLNLAKNAMQLFESSEIPEKRALLNYLLQNCVVNGKKLEFSIRSPFNHILNLATQPIGLPRQDSNLRPIA